MLLLIVVWLSGDYYYRRVRIRSEATSSIAAAADDDDVGISELAVVRTNDNGGGEPNTVCCSPRDHLLCYEGVCNITCSSYDNDGCVGSLVEEFERCQNESYVNLPMYADIPSEIGLLTDLKSARAGGYSPWNFPSELWTLTNLQVLDWGNNYVIFDFPTDVGRLTELTTLDISSTQATGRLDSGPRLES